jgi:hypothetical protein
MTEENLASPKKIKVLLLIVVLTPVLSFLAYLSLWECAPFLTGYTLNEMDWNQDRTTSLGEIFKSKEVGKRAIESNGKKMIEYYSLKDGHFIKRVDLSENKP